jgi:carbamoyl-phosphate synthase large subunit
VLCDSQIQEPLEKLLDIPREERFVFQECMSGTEFGFDLLADFSGRYQGYLARQKVTMRAGETDMAKTLRRLPVNFSMSHLAEVLGVVGLVDVDFIMSAAGPQAIIDINPRIGGGYPFSHMAGARLPQYILQWREGESVNLQSEPIRESQFGKEVALIEVPGN